MDQKELTALPATKQRALELGIQYYYTGTPCRRGHKAPRYASSGNCTRCFELLRGQKIPRKGRALANYQRAVAALAAGETTYVPETPCKHGHLLRYIGSNNCAACTAVSVAKKNKDGYHRGRYLKATYGITDEDYRNLLAKQNGGCAICGATAETQMLHVDHDHATRKIRGILCGPCNRGIGLLRESVDLFHKAAKYLKCHD